MSEIRTCLMCPKKIVGRTDKKYCSGNCRLRAHQLRVHERQPMGKVYVAISRTSGAVLGVRVTRAKAEEAFPGSVVEGYHY